MSCGHRAGRPSRGSARATRPAEGCGEDVPGLAVEPLTPETARQNRLSAPSGLLVTEMVPGSPGAEAGIQPGESVPVYLQRGGGRNEYVMLTVPRP